MKPCSVLPLEFLRVNFWSIRATLHKQNGTEKQKLYIKYVFLSVEKLLQWHDKKPWRANFDPRATICSHLI